MRRIVLTAAMTVVAMTAVPAAATAETAPLGGLLGDGGGLVGTNAQCDDGLLGIALGGSTVCVLPSVEGGPAQSASCSKHGASALRIPRTKRLGAGGG